MGTLKFVTSWSEVQVAPGALRLWLVFEVKVVLWRTNCALNLRNLTLGSWCQKSLQQGSKYPQNKICDRKILFLNLET